MRILESFSRFEVRAQIKYWIFFKSFAFVYRNMQERRFCFRFFRRKSNCGVVFISLLNELTISSILTKMSSKNLFETSGFVLLRLRISVSTFAMKMLAKLQTF